MISENELVEAMDKVIKCFGEGINEMLYFNHKFKKVKGARQSLTMSVLATIISNNIIWNNLSSDQKTQFFLELAEGLEKIHGNIDSDIKVHERRFSDD